MPELKYYKALTNALYNELERDERVVLIGEDVGASGGIFSHTKGLYEAFGPLRVRDTTIAEQSMIGMGVSAAMCGLRPIVEIGFSDFLMVCMDQIVNHAAKMRYTSGGTVSVPLTIYSWSGGGVQAGPQHSGSPEAMFAHVPGLKVVVPAFPQDVQGLMAAAVRDDNPVIVLIDKALRGLSQDVPEGDIVEPIGKAAVRREGNQVTLVAIGKMVHAALEAADKAAEEGISVDVIDLRSACPLDMDTVMQSLERTGRLVIVHEAVKQAGIGAEIAAQAAETLDFLDAPVVRVAPPFTPVPFAPPLEAAYLPSVDSIVNALREIV